MLKKLKKNLIKLAIYVLHNIVYNELINTIFGIK